MIYFSYSNFSCSKVGWVASFQINYNTETPADHVLFFFGLAIIHNIIGM